MLFTSTASLWLAATRRCVLKLNAACAPMCASLSAAGHQCFLHHTIHTTTPTLWTARRARQPVIYTPAAAMALLTTLGGMDAGSGVRGPDLWASVQRHPDFDKFNRRYMRRVRVDCMMWLVACCLHVLSCEVCCCVKDAVVSNMLLCDIQHKSMWVFVYRSVYQHDCLGQ